jgi:hypothetical protein
MKTFFRASVVASLMAASVAFVGEWPPQAPVRVTTGPEMRATESAPSAQSVRWPYDARSR